LKLALPVLTIALLLPAVAIAGPHHYYAPAAVDLGGQDAVELYLPVPFDAPTRLTGQALADASLASLAKAVPDAGAVRVAFQGSVAELTLAEDRAADAAVADRALGAVYYTLIATGFAEVRLAGQALAPHSFTRGAFAPVVPIHAALPAGSVRVGFVRVGAELVPVAAFYERLAQGEAQLQAAAREVLSGGGIDAKLALLRQLPAFRFRDQEAIVIERLKDPAPAVRLAALELLRGNSTRPVTRALEEVVEGDTSNEVKLTAVRMLVAAGRTEFSKFLLLDKLTDPDSSVVVEAVKGLVSAGDPAFASSIAELGTHGNPSVRAAAADALVTMKQHGLLAGWVGDDAVNRDVRQRAARILADSGGGPDKAAGLSWLVREGSEEDALHGAAIIKAERVPGTTEALGAALERGESAVRLAAADALAALRDAAGLEPLAKAVRAAGDAAEREAMSDSATAIISAQPIDQVIQISRAADLTVRELAIRALAAFSRDRPNPRAVEVLKAALAEQEPGIRQAATHALARIPDDGVVRALVALQEDSDPLVRAQVAHALGRARIPDADAILLRLMDDRDKDVKVNAINALRERGVKGAVDKLRWLVDHREIEVKRAAMHALVALAEPADPALFDIYAKAMIEVDAEFRIRTLQGLGGYKDDPRATRAIGTALLDAQADKRVRLHALEVLAEMTEPNTVDHVVRGLFDRDRDVKLATLDVLAKLGSDRAIRPLQEFIMGESDNEVVARAEQVLEGL